MKTRKDYEIIKDIIEPGSKVLDLGCGNGDLMELLVREKDVKVQGIELSDEAIHRCVEKGLSVFHSDIDTGLPEYPDKSFDHVILNQSLQEVKKVEVVLAEALRVGRRVIIGFPNFAHLGVRLAIFFTGRAPVEDRDLYHWYDTPTRNFLSIKDFRDYCSKKKIGIEQAHFISPPAKVFFWPNLFASTAVFVLKQ
jgi:methionine biosynthesis protein MetW